MIETIIQLIFVLLIILVTFCLLALTNNIVVALILIPLVIISFYFLEGTPQRIERAIIGIFAKDLKIVPGSLRKFVSIDSERNCKVLKNKNCCIYVEEEIEVRILDYSLNITSIKTKDMTKEQRANFINYLVRTFNRKTTYGNIYNYFINNQISVEGSTINKKEEWKKAIRPKLI
ncbi:hypothetical protein IKQ26_02360 [bacterium]|nr:hypothetical protein [bacterium]